MFYVRPIARDDLTSILALSERTGTGLTTLPANRDRLAGRIDRSLASFAGDAEAADACYMFVLVQGAGNGAGAAPDRVVGISAIEAAVGLKEPWYNYHVGTLVHASRQLGVYTAAPTLFLANDHTGHTELCSLFLDQAFRQGKNGVLLAKCRLLFIAEFAARFSAKVIAELRGRLDADGRSPFWEGLGRHFFAMEYSTADYLTGIGQKSFIAELMPKHPVYVNLLPTEAREAIGAVHTDTLPARTMLEQEGFRYEGYVDIFDAGPTLECFRDNIYAVRQSQVMPVTLGEEDPVPDSLTDDTL
jgi:arginine N-succinyltransferase